MPIYEYRCSQCKTIKEVDQRITDDPLTVCPDCHSPSLTKLFPRSVTFQFKGSGFYATDYQKKDPACCKGGCGCCSH